MHVAWGTRVPRASVMLSARLRAWCVRIRAIRTGLSHAQHVTE